MDIAVTPQELADAAGDLAVAVGTLRDALTELDAEADVCIDSLSGRTAGVVRASHAGLHRAFATCIGNHQEMAHALELLAAGYVTTDDAAVAGPR